MEATDRRHRWFCLAICAVVWAGMFVHAADRSVASPPTDTKPCSKRETAAGLRSFFAAFNKGDRGVLDARFAKQPAFEWYSSPAPGRRLGRAAKRRDTLVRYFAARHARRDRLHLRAFHFTGRTPHYSNFWFESNRRARGFRGGRWYRTGGKGAVICVDGQAQFIAMSLGSPES